MKISKSMFSRICIVAGFIVCSQFSFATDIIIRKDDQSPPPQPMPNGIITETTIPLTATVDNNSLAVYFEWSVGDATITVYDEYLNVVCQTVTDTDSDLSMFIPSDSWNAGNYTITIKYGSTDLIGNFTIE
ncbi:MAG: DUF3244 domain-containing protein [Paludibacter sp.]